MKKMMDKRGLLSPMVADNPDAVFLMRTHLDSLTDVKGFQDAGYRIANAVFKRPIDPNDISSPPVIIKPNVVNGNIKDKQGKVIPSDGIVTDVHFVEGITRFLTTDGANSIVIAEGGAPVLGNDGDYTMDQTFEERGYKGFAERMNLNLVGLNKQTYQDDDLTWIDLGDRGVVLREIPFVKPYPGEFVINVPTLKTHCLAVVTLCSKNIQGTIALPYRRHCETFERLKQYPPEILKHFQPDFFSKVLRLCEKHEREGYWRMDTQFELYGQRTCDTLMAISPQPTINIIEGIRGRDGTAFIQGQDWLANIVIAGINPVHVDTIASYLMGQTPRAVVAYLRIAEERGLGTCDPFAITTYVIEDDGIIKPCKRLSEWQIKPFLGLVGQSGSLHSRWKEME